MGKATGRTVVLVGCGDEKRATPTRACDLYTSGYFTLKRRVAEQASAWRILSAKYGVVPPEREVAPYDATLAEKSPSEIESWATAVLASLAADDAVATAERVVVLAGESYVAPLQPGLGRVCAPATLRFPLRRVGGIGEQMAVLAEMAKPGEQVSLRDVRSDECE